MPYGTGRPNGGENVMSENGSVEDAPDRFTMGLMIDIMTVLDQHGYERGAQSTVPRLIGPLADLVRAYEGGDRK
ncbi:hypothetical protein [Streptomyces sp. N35]|uniref:hypothetical protein n=1 Tax=Streptomyces sp. N35 TaxID=2795730 RepID=UPI0018F6D3D2|nr:hypothetical protein [Streptomyces sp. N35]